MFNDGLEDSTATGWTLVPILLNLFELDLKLFCKYIYIFLYNNRNNTSKFGPAVYNYTDKYLFNINNSSAMKYHG